MSKCGKICFPSKQSAERAMRRFPTNKLTLGRVPNKAYRCGKCKAWHYTSVTISPQKRKRS